jgi:serine/threonine-protein kinase
VLGAGLIWMSLRPTATTNSLSEIPLPITTRATILLPLEAPLAPTHATPFGCPENALALSPDGANLVYVALVNGKRQLWRRPMDGQSAQPIPNTEGAYVPFFSPDSRWVAFFADGKVKKVALAGGAPEVLCAFTNEAHAGIWREDGYLYVHGDFRVSERGGAREEVPELKRKDGWLVSSTAVPGGQHLVYDAWTSDVLSGDFSPLELFSTATKSFRTLAVRGHNPRFLPPGYLVFAREAGLHVVAFDARQGEIRSEPAPVIDGVRGSAAWRVAHYSVSTNGTLVYAAGGRLDHTIPAWVTRDGKVTKLPMASRLYGQPRLSPDGRRLAVEMPDAQDAIWIFDTETGTGVKLTEPGTNRHPVWMPDSQQLIFTSYRDEHWEIHQKDLSRADQPSVLLLRSNRPRSRLWPEACSPDSRVLVVVSAEESGNLTSSFLHLVGDRTAEPLGLPPDVWAIDFSPDGQWITYNWGGSGEIHSYIRRFPTGEEKQVSTVTGEEPRWSAKGDELFYRYGDTWYSVTVTLKPSMSAYLPRKLFSGGFYNAPGLSYAVAPDAQRFLVFVPEPPDVPITQLEVITNWTTEVARKVAAGKSDGRRAAP